MAIVKHNSSKNADYGSILEYYTEQHVEDQRTGHYEPVLDEYGLRQLRENCSTFAIGHDGQDIDPEQWAAECLKTNIRFNKNRAESDVKSHEYIISHPAEDREKMTMEDLQQEARDFVRDNLQGYDCLISVHRDTDNDHIHVSFNSVRAGERERKEDWMKTDKSGAVKQSELEAGGKHQDSAALRVHLNEWLLQYTKEHELTQEDNNRKARQHKTSKTDYLRSAALDCAARATSPEELKRLLQNDYGVELRVRGSTISLRHPDSKKATRLDTLQLAAADLQPGRGHNQNLKQLIESTQRERERKEQARRQEERAWARYQERAATDQQRQYSFKFYPSENHKPWEMKMYDENGKRLSTAQLIYRLGCVIARTEDPKWFYGYRRYTAEPENMTAAELGLPILGDTVDAKMRVDIEQHLAKCPENITPDQQQQRGQSRTLHRERGGE